MTTFDDLDLSNPLRNSIEELGFTHPTSGKWMQFETDLPEDMTNVLSKWDIYTSNRED